MPLDTPLLLALTATIIAGFVRGFTGFGGALIFMPVASAAFTPQLAAPLFLIIDFVLTFPLFLAALRYVQWTTVLPAALAAITTAPIGAYLLLVGDTETLRWAISLIVIALLLLLISGWRYEGKPRPLPSIGVGATAGFLGGIGQVSGPPVIAYWVSGPDTVAVIRANMFCFFAVTSLSSFAAYFWNGLFNREVGEMILRVGPAYAVALVVGGFLFRRTDGAAYRPLAYVVIALAALTSTPVFDGLLR